MAANSLYPCVMQEMVLSRLKPVRMPKFGTRARLLPVGNKQFIITMGGFRVTLPKTTRCRWHLPTGSGQHVQTGRGKSRNKAVALPELDVMQVYPLLRNLDGLFVIGAAKDSAGV